MNTVKLILNTNKVFKKFNRDTLLKLFLNIYVDTKTKNHKKYNIDIMRITNNIIYNIFENYNTNLDEFIDVIIDYLLTDNSILANSTLIKIINKALLYDNNNIIDILKEKLKGKELEIYLDNVNASKIKNNIPKAVNAANEPETLKAVVPKSAPVVPKAGPASAQAPAPAVPKAALKAAPKAASAPGLKAGPALVPKAVSKAGLKAEPAPTPQSNELSNKLKKYTKMLKTDVPIIDTKSKMRLDGITNEEQELVMRVSGIAEKSNEPQQPPVIASGVPRKVAAESFQEQIAASVKARTARGANAISNVAQIQKKIFQENPIFKNIKKAAQKNRTAFVDPRNGKNDPKKIGKVVETIIYSGKKFTKKNTGEKGVIKKIISILPDKNISFEVKYNDKPFPTSGVLLSTLNIVNNQSTASVPPKPVPAPAPSPPLLKGQPLSSIVKPTKQQLISALKKSKKPLLDSKPLTFRNEQQPGKSLINTQNSKYSLENLGINSVVKTSEVRKQEKHQQNIKRGRPKKTIPVNQMNNWIKEKNRAEQIESNTKNAVSIGKIHASSDWQASNKNIIKYDKY
jgi:uncharacterized protein (UPF0147 family)